MLIQLGVHKDLAKCHSFARRIPPGTSVLWNGKQGGYEVACDAISKTRRWALLMTTGGCLYGLNAWTAWKSGDQGLGVLGGCISLVAISVALSSVAFRENASDCAEFLNGLLYIANDRRNDEAFQECVRPRAVRKLLIQGWVMIQVVHPWFYSLVAVAAPCSPLNMFSSMIGWCSDETSSTDDYDWLAKRVAIGVGTAIPHVIFWNAFLPQLAIGCIHLLVGSLCQKSLLGFMSNRLLVPEEDVDLSSHLKLYRTCQIINIYFGTFCSSVSLAIIAVILIGEVATTFLLFKILGGSSDLPLLNQIMIVGACPTLYLFHLMAVGEAGQVNSLSLSVLTKVMKLLNAGGGSKDKKLTRLQLRSAWPLKIKIGQSNFIEASTTLVRLDFTFSTLVDLLLIDE